MSSRTEEFAKVLYLDGWTWSWVSRNGVYAILKNYDGNQIFEDLYDSAQFGKRWSELVALRDRRLKESRSS